MADDARPSTALAVLHQTTPAEITFDQMERMADSFAKSNLFGVKTKDAALSLLMIAQAEGIHPALAVMEYDIIEGKPARKAERLLARFQMSGGKVKWLSYTDDNVTAEFSHPMGSDVTVDWTIAKAQKVRYYTKDGWKPLADKYNWKNWPRAMLRSRCIAEGVRACFPGASLVTLTSEEAQDLGEPMEARVVDRGGDNDQRPDGERVYPAKLIGQAGKDLFDDLAQRMTDSADGADLEIIWSEAEQSHLSSTKMFALSEHYEACKEAHETGKGPPDAPRFSEAPEPSPFEALNKSGAEVSDRDGFKAWTARLTPETLGKCTDQERATLKATHAAAKKRVTESGRGAGPDEDAGNAPSGGADGKAAVAAQPAASSIFEALKAQGEAILKLKGKRRMTNALTEWRGAVEAAKYEVTDIEAADLKALDGDIAAKADAA